MLKLLERAVASVDQNLILLAPPDTAVPDVFNACDFDLDRHTRLIREVQRLRGDIYYNDGAIGRDELSPEGLHRTPEDERAWHLLVTDRSGRVTACSWYREHDNNVYFGRLRLRNCPLASAPEWRDSLWQAVDRDIARARQDGLRYAELGGWAVAPDARFTSDPFVLAVATYGLSRVGGGAVGLTTATTRHGSAQILTRLGGRPLDLGNATLPAYYDPRYRCTMQVLRFDSRKPSARIAPLIDMLCDRLPEVSVVARPYWPCAQRQPAAAWIPAVSADLDHLDPRLAAV